MSNKGTITIENLLEAIKSLPDCPKISDLSFVKNNLLPENTVMVSPKVMELLNNIFKHQTPKP